MTTAELLGNAALGIAALVAIWAVHPDARARRRRLDPRSAARLTSGRRGHDDDPVRRRDRAVAASCSSCWRTSSSTSTPAVRRARGGRRGRARRAPRSTRRRPTASGAPTTCSTTCSAARCGRAVHVSCREVDGAMHAQARVVLAGWLPGVPDWSFTVDGTVVKEHDAVTARSREARVRRHRARARHRPARAPGRAAGADAAGLVGTADDRARHRPRGGAARRPRRRVRPGAAPGARRDDGAQPRRPERRRRGRARRAPTAPSSRPGSDVEARVTVRDARGAASRPRRGRRVVAGPLATASRSTATWRARVSAPRPTPGTITLWLLGLCLMLFALGGISARPLASFSERRALAATADAAALAGASAIDEDAVPAVGRHRRSCRRWPKHARAAHVATQLDRPRCAAVGGARRHRGGHGRRPRHASASRCSACSRRTATSTCRSPRPRRRGGRDDPPTRARGRDRVARARRRVRGACRRHGPDERRRRARARLRARDGERSRRRHLPRWWPPERRARRRCRRYTWSRAHDRRAVRRSSPGPIPRRRSPAVVTPLPGIVVFPYAPLHVGHAQGAPPGAVRARRRRAAPARGDVGGRLRRRPGHAARRRARRVRGAAVRASRGAALPADPPTAAEIWEQTPLPRADGARVAAGHPRLARDREPRDPVLERARSPDARADRACSTATSVDVVAHPVAYAWSFGDGTTCGGVRTRGAPTRPSRVDVPSPRRLRRGALRRSGQGSRTSPRPALGLDFGCSTSAPSPCPSRSPYHVAEIRALLRSRTARG